MDQTPLSASDPSQDQSLAAPAVPPPRRRRERDLTPRMQRFAEEFRHDGNAVQAALRAGYTLAFARRNSYRLLKDHRVLQQIRYQPDPDEPELQDALRELSLLAFSNVMDVVRVKPDGRIELDPARLDRRRTAGVRELIIDERVDKATGDVHRRVRLRMADRKDALVKLIAGLKLSEGAFERGYEVGKEEVLLHTSVEEIKRMKAAQRR
ncbi:MAG: Terminase small subunit [Caulobacter sp.]|nr:Terminase small subunit [Caulobacter sp.]